MISNNHNFVISSALVLVFLIGSLLFLYSQLSQFEFNQQAQNNYLYSEVDKPPSVEVFHYGSDEQESMFDENWNPETSETGFKLYDHFHDDIRKSQDIDDKTLEEAFPMAMSERRMKETLIFMLNSKVVAEWKFNVFEITEERTERLLKVVRERGELEADFEHGEIYLNILLEWQNNNFSNSVDHHEILWGLRNGKTDGEAIRLFTPEEEQEFKEKGYPLPQAEHFKLRDGN
ncbi:DUF6241 domain-containing protein [Bacillus shivajii]|uniref:DUF6241 domain-containing protein n=1 Tax=Bacillus shivajii TaxID=1983719 RepID=UPI001CFA4386|nr:DUF6241 domain-containing protein [Bacillus shivajii]UCZ55019.1 DUF6241 domain-containing protein [Bacillus shivajii]